MVVKLRILADIERQVTELYNRIEKLLKELDIKWTDLARVIEPSPKGMTCKQCITTACVTGNQNATIIEPRLDVRQADIRKKLSDIKTKGGDKNMKALTLKELSMVMNTL